MPTPTLDTRPARTDLTSRECAKLIGGTVGVLVMMAPIKAIRDAVIWIAQHDEYWEMLEASIPRAVAAISDDDAS